MLSSFCPENFNCGFSSVYPSSDVIRVFQFAIFMTSATDASQLCYFSQISSVTALKLFLCVWYETCWNSSHWNPSHFHFFFFFPQFLHLFFGQIEVGLKVGELNPKSASAVGFYSSWEGNIDSLCFCRSEFYFSLHNISFLFVFCQTSLCLQRFTAANLTFHRQCFFFFFLQICLISVA